MIVTVEATIEKPIAEVFAIVCDMHYMKGVETIDADIVSLEKLTEGPITVGTIWRETLKVRGSTMAIDIPVTSVEPGRSAHLDVRSKFVDSIASITCAPSGEHLGCTFHVHSTTKPGIGWLIYPMVKADLGKRERRRVAAVKRVIESGELQASQAESIQA